MTGLPDLNTNMCLVKLLERRREETVDSVNTNICLVKLLERLREETVDSVKADQHQGTISNNYIIKQDIFIYVSYSRLNGWTEWAEIFCGYSWVV